VHDALKRAGPIPVLAASGAPVPSVPIDLQSTLTDLISDNSMIGVPSRSGHSGANAPSVTVASIF